jgi:hypothetical protein
MPSNYTNVISINQALYFDLFDDIEYKWLKIVLDPALDREDECDFEVEIEDLPCDRLAFCKIKFTFELQMVDDIRWGETYYKTQKFSKTIEYNGSSAFAMTLCGMVADNDSEEEEEGEPINIEALKKRQGLDEDDGFIKFLRKKQAKKTEEDAVNVN